MENGYNGKRYPVIYEQPCSTTVASGVYYGIFLGGVYGTFFGTLEVLSAPKIDKELFKDVGKSTLIATGGLAAMLAIYNGTECFSRQVRGKRDFVNSAIGGFFTGGVYGMIATNRSISGSLKTAVAGFILGSISGLLINLGPQGN